MVYGTATRSSTAGSPVGSEDGIHDQDGGVLRKNRTAGGEVPDGRPGLIAGEIHIIQRQASAIRINRTATDFTTVDKTILHGHVFQCKIRIARMDDAVTVACGVGCNGAVLSAVKDHLVVGAVGVRILAVAGAVDGHIDLTGEGVALAGGHVDRNIAVLKEVDFVIDAVCKDNVVFCADRCAEGERFPQGGGQQAGVCRIRGIVDHEGDGLR